MAYLLIENFRLGMDLRKSATSAEPGSLRVLKNGFITAGGEIAKRKALTSLGQMPGGATRGLGFHGQSLAVFGTQGAPGGLPPDVTFRPLAPEDMSLTLEAVTAVRNFGAGLYVVAVMSDGKPHHFYDGREVTGAAGSTVLGHRKKLYATDGVNLRFSGVASPTGWKDATGAGVIDVSAEDTATTDLVGLERYYSSLAVFARTFVQIWGMDPDPAQSTLLQTLSNIGLVAPNAAAGYGNGDVLFLSDTGLRSIRARDSSNAAVLNDIGSPLDAWVQAKRASLTPAEAGRIRALVDPLTGHFWLIWGHEAAVLALYPGTKIAAWSLFDFGETIDDAVVANSRIALRRGDELLVYGPVPADDNPFDPNTPVGSSAEFHDATPVEIETPFLDAKRPAAVKHWTGVDMTCSGTWAVFVNPDPNVPDGWVRIGTVTRDTWGEGRLPIDMTATHLAVRLVSEGTGFAKLATLALHFEGGEET